MKRIITLLSVFSAFLFVTSVAWAQSSGSFNYAHGYTSCVLNGKDGTITGGQECGPMKSCTATTQCGSGYTCYNPSGDLGAGICYSSLQGSPNNLVTCTSSAKCDSAAGDICLFYGGSTGSGVCGVPGSASTDCVGSLTTTLKTSSGNGNVFDIRPSAVIGLLTDAKIQGGGSSSTTTGTSTSYAGVDFTVSVTPLSGQAAPTIEPNEAVTYDARFIEISSNLFQALATSCTSRSTTVGAGCYITFDESTVSAHSFDWVASNLSSGDYGLTASWTSSLGDFGISDSMTCVGPVNFTVQQDKVFSASSGISFPN